MAPDGTPPLMKRWLPLFEGAGVLLGGGFETSGFSFDVSGEL